MWIRCFHPGRAEVREGSDYQVHSAREASHAQKWGPEFRREQEWGLRSWFLDGRRQGTCDLHLRTAPHLGSLAQKPSTITSLGWEPEHQGTAGTEATRGTVCKAVAAPGGLGFGTHEAAPQSLTGDEAPRTGSIMKGQFQQVASAWFPGGQKQSQSSSGHRHVPRAPGPPRTPFYLAQP